MAAVVGSEDGPGRTALERFGSGGLALLPRTRQMLTVLWEQLRLLLQVIYYTFMSVFQMFRFEVHVRITDETGQHIQHMSTAANPPESFLFSSLFDGDGGVMVGGSGGVMVGGSGPLSNFCADDPFSGKSPTEALLSSLRADELCCGLVDDFVTRTSGKDDGIFVGQQSSWKMGFPGDWNIFVSSNDGSSSGDACHRSSERVSSEEERSSQWSSEEDQNLVEFHDEETKALWESLSRSSDPYNPFFFSACISTNNSMGKKDHRETDLRSVSTAGEELLGPTGLKMWVSRSDSESSWSSSDGSSANMDEETERLLEFFSSPDPYNPMCFSACSVTQNAAVCEQQASLPAPPPRPDADAEETENGPPPSSEDDEEEQLWKSLCSKDDPYHPFNFQARLPASSPHTTDKDSENSRTSKPVRRLKHRCHPDQTLVPWKRPGQAKRTDRNPSSAQKKVRFSPLVHVHVMRSWSFARQASRKGHWEEMARDRDRFRRRIQETELSIGHCFSAAHRRRMQTYLDASC